MRLLLSVSAAAAGTFALFLISSSMSLSVIAAQDTPGGTGYSTATVLPEQVTVAEQVLATFLIQNDL